MVSGLYNDALLVAFLLLSALEHSVFLFIFTDSPLTENAVTPTVVSSTDCRGESSMESENINATEDAVAADTVNVQDR